MSVSYLAKIATDSWVDAREVLSVLETKTPITGAVVTEVTLRNGTIFKVAAPAARVVAKIDAAYQGQP